MIFKLTTGTVYTIKELIDSKSYFPDYLDGDDTVLIRINHLPTAEAPANVSTSRVYVEGSGVKVGEQATTYVINDVESDYIPYDDKREFAITYKRLQATRLVCCCADTTIKMTIL
jgi:hypothetical protein